MSTTGYAYALCLRRVNLGLLTSTQSTTRGDRTTRGISDRTFLALHRSAKKANMKTYAAV
ncbi:hypothetical protein [Tolypothrix sp. NIES-4075]|uniref:hypothetical protein n=1 Tax=Tolypothrix sp. NIES-4075 TaxID=2005459 RepID=UPI001180D0BF|nr:hypothetical protein [Tolypothrix sp. NIES-4075]